MITAEDLELAQALLAQKRVDPSELEKALASMGVENSGKSLRAVLEARGLLKHGSANYGATLIPGEAVGEPAPPPAAAAPGRFDRTMMASDSGIRLAATPPESSRAPGARSTRCIGRFEIVDEIARGGMGIVYRAWEGSLNRHVALKVLIAGEGASEDQVQRFLREAQAAAGLQHPNIVQVYEVGQEAGSHWFAMELVDGPSLDRLVKEQGAFPPRTALRIIRDIARALHFAHQKGIIHRDVKPGNIMVASVGRAATSSVSGEARPMRVLLGDFGLARDLSAGGGLTLSGNLLGTPAYMSPEQAAGRTKQVDAKSDIFALGSVLYELLCGKAPFQAASLGEVLTAIIACEPPSIRSMRPGLHRDIEVIVQKAMAKEKDRRYATAGELADDIDRYLNGEAILAEAPSAWYRLTRWARGHAASAVAAAVILAAAGTAGGVWWGKRVQARAAEARRAEDARTDLLRQVGNNLAEARELAAQGNFREAALRIGTARSLKEDDTRVEETAKDVRRIRLIHDVGEIAAKTDPTPEETATARSILAMNGEFRGEAEVMRLARFVEGTCSWSVETNEKGIDVDLCDSEQGIQWDEETFPPLGAARESGLCRRIGTAPLPLSDIPFGEYHLVFSRGGNVERVVPVRFRRNTMVVFEHRIVRVGTSSEAAFRSVEEAAVALKPGGTVLLQDGEFPGFGISGRPGLLIAAAPGAHPSVIDPHGAAISISDCYGIRLRDISIDGAPSSPFGVFFSPRFSAIRCPSTAQTPRGIEISDSAEWHIRDCSFRVGVSGYALRIGGEVADGLTIGTSFQGGTWATAIGTGTRFRFVRCYFGRGALAAGQFEGDGNEFLECEFRDNPNWGLILQKQHDGVVADCLFVNCGATPSTTATAGALVVGGGGARVEHNTFVGGDFTAVTWFGPGRFSDNLIGGVAPLRNGKLGAHPGGAIFVRGEAGGPVIQGNLYWLCEIAGRVGEKGLPSAEEFNRAAAAFGCPTTSAVSPLRLVDCGPLGADGSLPADSPALGAASDGTDVGSRREALRKENPTSVDWIITDIARTWATRGKGAFEKKDRAAAESYLRKSRVLRPGDPAVLALEALLK
ncbi:MAG: protein kinase [Planctomycetes bacterium]|nr:protein kinase [Planctomycetota bacterium]